MLPRRWVRHVFFWVFLESMACCGSEITSTPLPSPITEHLHTKLSTKSGQNKHYLLALLEWREVKCCERDLRYAANRWWRRLLRALGLNKDAYAERDHWCDSVWICNLQRDRRDDHLLGGGLWSGAEKWLRQRGTSLIKGPVPPLPPYCSGHKRTAFCFRKQLPSAWLLKPPPL